MAGGRTENCALCENAIIEKDANRNMGLFCILPGYEKRYQVEPRSVCIAFFPVRKPDPWGGVLERAR